MSSDEKINAFMKEVKDLLYDRFGEDTSPGDALAASAVLLGLASGYYGNYLGNDVKAIEKLLGLLTDLLAEKKASLIKTFN